MAPALRNNSPILIITCGLTGTGKSTIINEVARTREIAILTSDKIRKELVGITPEEHKYEDFNEGIYSEGFTERTYHHMIEEGKKLLMGGKSVILDACFPKQWQRKEAEEGAREANARFLCIEFICSPEEAKKRLTTRFESKEGISDGRWEIYTAQRESFDAVEEFASELHMVVDTSKPEHECVNSIMQRLDALNS